MEILLYLCPTPGVAPYHFITIENNNLIKTYFVYSNYVDILVKEIY